ncbi:MAG: hypothetical protein JEZ12_07505 [Desulfobacterium sp.]|nr:hypothetical protein [Desulfobacterium sp.]
MKRGGKKALTMGVFIEHSHVSLVLTRGAGGSGDTKDLVKWAYVPVPDELDMEHERFASFLKSTIGDFLAGHGKAAVWTLINSKNLKLRNIVIPDLPPSKLPNAAFWGLKKEVDLDPDNDIFDFHILGSVQSNGVKKKNVIAFSGLKNEIKMLTQLFSKAGYPLAGITAAPFALQNFMGSDRLKPEAGPEILVNVARYHTEITCFHRSKVQLVRSIRTGSHSLVEELLDTSSDPEVKSWDILEILSSSLGRESSLFAAMEPSAERLVGKVLRSGDYCSNNYASNEPVHQYLFFGETDNCQPFMAYAADQTQTEVKRFNPFEKNPGLTLSTRFPEGAGERTGIIPALGAALSTRTETPNFLNTYVQRDNQAKYRKMNAIILGLCLITLLGFGGCWWWQDSVYQAELAEKNQIDARIAKYVPKVSEETLNETLKQAGERSQAIKAYASDYLPLAVINELCSLTPDVISLVSLESDFKQELPDSVKKSGKANKARRSVLLTGIVRVDYTALESTLTGYVITLGDSPVFGEIMLLNKTLESIEEENLLKFTADMEIL